MLCPQGGHLHGRSVLLADQPYKQLFPYSSLADLELFADLALFAEASPSPATPKPTPARIPTTTTASLLLTNEDLVLVIDYRVLWLRGADPRIQQYGSGEDRLLRAEQVSWNRRM